MEHRRRLEVAASLMLQEHPLGIGPNCFTSKLLHGGYGDRGGLDWRQRVSIVHNIYLLTAAEMGYAGVVALVVLFLVPLGSALRHGLFVGDQLKQQGIVFLEGLIELLVIRFLADVNGADQIDR